MLHKHFSTYMQQLKKFALICVLINCCLHKDVSVWLQLFQVVCSDSEGNVAVV